MLREADLYAATPRDHTQPAEALIRHKPQELSPGGFIGGSGCQSPISAAQTSPTATQCLQKAPSAAAGQEHEYCS